MTPNIAEDNHEVEVLGNIMFNVPRSTFFMARINETWCGNLIDEAGPHSTTSLPASDIHQNAYIWMESFCLVFKDPSMLDQFLLDEDPELAPLQQFVREVIRYGRTPIVLLLDELSELFETNLDEHIVEGEDWCRLMHRVNLPHKDRTLLDLIGFAAPSLWSFRDWTESDSYRFRFTRMLVELHARTRILTGLAQSRISGTPVSYGTRRGVQLLPGHPVRKTTSDMFAVLDLRDGSNPRRFPVHWPGAITATGTYPTEPFRHGLLYQLPELKRLRPDTSATTNQSMPRSLPLDVQTAVANPPKAQHENLPSETKVPHG